MITLEDSAAQWAKYLLHARADDLKRAAKAARQNAKHNVLLAKAAEFVASAYERQARELVLQSAEINPNPGGAAGRLYKENSHG